LSALFEESNPQEIIMKKIVFLLSLILISETHAETLAQFEKKLIQHYTQKDFYEVNQTIESEIVAKIESDSRSFNYTFPTFQDQYNLRIHYSPDKRLKFYTFDVGSGGTMGSILLMCKLKMNGNLL
jgi:hypothetical protein